eukprot:4460436-Pleurochrysis_carterae.AAC.1
MREWDTISRRGGTIRVNQKEGACAGKLADRKSMRRQRARCPPCERAHMFAVVEAPHARRLVGRARDDVLAVG